MPSFYLALIAIVSNIMNIYKLFEGASKSRFGKWKLNFLLHRYIPFNQPHDLRVEYLSDQEVKVLIPYKRKNLNHIKGLHACVLATAAEYSSGLLLLYKLGFEQYRLIMKSINVEYHYQGKMSAIAIYKIDEDHFKKEIKAPLDKNGEVYTSCKIECYDLEDNHLCTASTNWQIKSWGKVRTKT